MAKQLNQVNVNLAFTADTGKARAQLQELQNTLKNFSTNTALKTSGLGLTKELQDAANAASELQIKLQQSMTSTGSLDLGKFNQSLKSSGKQLSDYANQLKNLGPEGQQAFSQLARSITLAEVPLKRSSKLLSEFATTMKNTVRWQLTSSMLHSFMGAMSSAYGYAQDLNESLNNIRIVTGQNVDQMARFANEANKAAKALSTTTTAYTDAALIYYQQGLNDTQVKERTDITIKMANVSRQSAEEVSDQLTAVWNNFAKGGESLEHFADVMTRLGADTASSSDEIAQGLEKFSAVADMIGLSFDNAAAALATVTATTRQSADVVGTAFKTIFARIQGLSLGETLDDGTNLNKYSKALEAVGINIKEQNGELKDMDSILAEMGAKWKMLSKDQQVALAQTVAGVRQYNQLIALMDNFDFYQKNLLAAQNSTGTLQEQADIYAESWEAARDRVKASLQGIYGDVLDDDVFIGILNDFSGLLDAVNLFIDAIGGLKGLLPLISTLLFKAFGDDLANSINRVFYNIKLGSEKGRKEIYDLRKEAAQSLRDMYDDGTASGSAMVDVGTKQADLQNILLDKTLQLQSANKNLTEEEKKQAQQLLDINSSLSDQYVQLVKNREKSQEISDDLILKAKQKGGNELKNFDITDSSGRSFKGKDGFAEAAKQAGNLQNTYKQGQKIIKSYGKAIDNLGDIVDINSDEFKNLQTRLIEVGKAADASGDIISQDLNEQLQALATAAANGDIKGIQAAMEEISIISEKAGDDAYDMFVLIEQGAQNAGVNMKTFKPILDQIQDEFEQTGALSADAIQLFANLGFQVDESGRIISSFKGKIASVGDAVAATASAVSTYGMALSQASAFGENLFDPDTKPLEKLISLMILGTTIIQTYNAVNKAGKTIEEAITAAKVRKAAAQAASAATATAEKVATDLNTAAVNKNKIAWLSHPILGVIAIALMAVVGVISAVSARLEANSEKLKENAEASKEAADATYEEAKANEELFDSFEKALAEYEDGIGSKEDLEAATKALCEAYDIENTKLIEARGNYKELTRAIKEAEQAKLDQAITDAKSAITHNEEAFKDTMRDGKGRFSGDDYIVDFGGISNASYADEQTIRDAVSNLQQDGKLKSDFDDNSEFSGKLTLTTGQTPAEMIAAYEDVQAIILETKRIAQENGTETELNDSEYWNQMNDWLSKSKENYDNLVALQSQLQDLSVMSATNEVAKNYGDIESMEEYLAMEKELAETLASNKDLGLSVEEAEELARASLQSEAAYADMAYSAGVIKEAAAEANGAFSESELQEFYNSLNKDEQSVFATLRFDTADSIEDLESQLEILQARADRTAILTKIETVDAAKSDLKSDMTAEDYKAYETSSGIDWGNQEEGIISYTEFLSMSFEEQTLYLEDLSNKYSEELTAATDTAVAANKARIKEITPDMQAAVDKMYEMEDAWTSMISDNDAAQILLNSIRGLDTEADNYQQTLDEILASDAAKEAGLTQEAVESYLDATNNAVALKDEITYLTDEVAQMEESANINNILKAKEAREELVALQGTLSELKFGETIDAEEFMLLNQYMPELAENFTKTTDGAYKLTEGIEEVNNCFLLMAQLVDDAGNKLFSGFDIAGMAKDFDDLHLALESGAINLQEFNTRWAELNQVADLEGLDVEELDEYSDYLSDIASTSADLSDELVDNDEAAKIVAKGIMKMNDAIDDLADNFDNWKDVLRKSTKGSEEYSKALKGTQKAVSNLLDVSEDYVSDDFIVEHLDDIEKAATGDAEAIDNLKAALAKDIIANIVIENGLDENARAEIIAAAEDLQASIPDIKVGASIDIDNMSADEAAFLEQCNKIIADANMTAEQANAYFDAMGFETKFATEEQPIEQRNPITVTKTEVKGYTSGTTTGPDGEPREWEYPILATSTYNDGYSTETGMVDAIAMATSTDGSAQVPKIESMTKKATGSANNYSPSNPGGKKPGPSGGKGGSSKKSEGKPKKSDVVDRYKEIEDKIDDIRNSADKASNAMDRLFGAKKIQKMQEVNKLLGNEVDLLKAKRNEAEKYLVNDEANLKQAVAKYGGSVKNVELVNGNIDNYDEILSALFDELYAATPKEGAEISDAQQEKIDAIQNRIDKIKEAISQYDETRELIEDLDNEIQDKLYEIQDRNFEILNYKLELKVEVDEAALKRLDYFLNKFSDDFYKMAESAALMNKQIPTYKSLIGSYEEYKTSLDTAYSKGEISQADYIEGLKQVRDGIYEQLEALNDLDKQMLHYYEDTLSAATDELADHTDHMEHLTSVFEHYQNLLGIIGKSKDYEAMGNFLQGQADTIKDRLSVAQSYYDVLLQQKDEIQAELQAAIASGDKAKIEMYQKEWDAIVDETDAAQEQVLSLTEEWAEAMKSVIQNNMEKIADTLEKTLTGGTTFDTLMDGFDKLNTRQEEYLTKTNQIYETNKLMRTASKALDETDNKVAKQKLKNFIDETKGLQETTQLSKYELEIQQAKYDLLLAQIALEEAQNAKSTVRLSRDNEGNFGYVYTADQNKIDDAQQAVDDADNSLYNLSLEGQQQYTEKYLQAQQSMYEELKQLQQDYLDGNIASEEEYERIKEQILNHYLGPDGVLTTYQNLYNVAVRTDANATADYWGQEYGRMTQDTETWKTAVNNYLLEIDGQIEEWKNVQTTANQEVGGALSNSKKATEELTTESGKLKDTINDEVIPTISDEIDAVKEQTDAYAAQRAELQALINTYENYLSALDATISANSIGFDKNTDYSALMNEYLNSGGKTTDKAFQDLLKQRNAKIEWLESDAGGNKGSEYWGTKGADTLAYYETLTSGGGSEEQRAWFEKDYMTKDEMLDKLNNLGISTEELELAINEVKASTDTVGEKITETGNNTNTKLEEVGNNTNSKLEETTNNTNSKIDDSKETLNTSINDSKETLNTSIGSHKDETVKILGDIKSTIENKSGEIIGSIGDAASDIIGSIGSAASEVSSSVGGAISSIRSEISSLRGSVTGATIGSIAGPIGTAIGGVIGGAIGKAKRYDTGGYTGDWGPEGKLAILDQKELVLNQNDTQNLLSTVSLIRELVSMIDAQAANASLFNLMSSPSPNTNTNTLEQKVEITAEFPNVNDRYEIEEAFNNLVNRASQYANKAF